jgi:hypothetical protein
MHNNLSTLLAKLTPIEQASVPPCQGGDYRGARFPGGIRPPLNPSLLRRRLATSPMIGGFLLLRAVVLPLGSYFKYQIRA